MPKVILIDANALKSVICRKCANGEIIDDECNGESCFMLREIDNAPKIEAEPVRHGRWILSSDEQYEYCTCSECGYQNGENWMIGSDIAYCANCGAKMDAADTNVLTNEGGVKNDSERKKVSG